ncbi:bifunctional DNA primase/polymerase [Pelagibacterium sp.]|uniref:bifunctional DNA primase/polymerase n=1 Tax=Pelagibacterium sp. TaxID=1967288 RepID=UPI003A8F0973
MTMMDTHKATHPPRDPFLSITAEIFGGADEVDLPDSRKATSLMHNPGEAIFGGVANEIFANGWCCFPQERDGRRLPSRVDGATLKWGKYIEERPKASDIARWAHQAYASNLAVILGPVSGNSFVLDIDVLDPELSLDVQELAATILGRSRLRRQGQAPKMALFYRVADASELPANESFRFCDEDGGLSEHGLEILGRGKTITLYGNHHKTGGYFKWADAQPTHAAPDVAPLVTGEQVTEFLAAVQELRAFHSGGKRTGFMEVGDGSLEVDTSGWIIPRDREGTVAKDGMIADGREGWLKSFTFDLVRFNHERLDTAQGVASAVDVALRVAKERLDLSGKQVGGTDIRTAVVDRIQRAVAMLHAGEITHLPKPRREGDGTLRQSRKGVLQSSTWNPWFLPPADKRKPLNYSGMTAPDAEIAKARALKTDRSATAEKVERQVHGALGQFFDAVYSIEIERPVAHVLKAPTGAGKTTRAISYIAHDPRTFSGFDIDDQGEGPGPILFLLPTYNNIDELRRRAETMNLDPLLDDEDLAAQATELGIYAHDRALEEIADLRLNAEAAGLKTMTYQGKIAAGCQFEEKVQALMDAGVATSGLCHARMPTATGEMEDRYCPHYATCPAIQQRARIAESHIVFMPHAFLNLTIPEELKTVRAVIADERIFTMSVHTAQFPTKSLDLPRDEPRLTNKERELGLHPIELLQERDAAVDLVKQAFSRGMRPAELLHLHSEANGKKTVTGADLVHSAARVCGSASSSNVAVYPGMPDAAFADIVTRATGRDVKAEYRFWKIIEQQIAAIDDGTDKPQSDKVVQERMEEDEKDRPVSYIRISWMTHPNWPAAPLLLLDASANEQITNKVFPDRDIVVHDIDADLNLRIVAIADKRMANNGLVAGEKARLEKRALCAQNIETIRAVENHVSAIHANGRVAHAMPKALRREYCWGYATPGNVDYLHYGAERGLNFAERHLAALVTGRMELPPHVYDGIAAALAYGDDQPFELLDPRGNGLDADDKPIRPRVGDVRLAMRDGSDISLETALNPAGWLRIVQEQFREEPIRQSVGRLRPVYREDTPVAYIMSQCIPEGLIVDELVSAADMIPEYAELLDASRSMYGVLDYHLAYQHRSDLATLEEFRRQFSLLPAELKAGFDAVGYVRDRGDRYHAGVPVHWRANACEFVESLVAQTGHQTQSIRVTRAASNEPVAPAADRPIDAIETEIGSLEQRMEHEWTDRHRVIERMVAAHAADTSQPPYYPGKGRYPVGAGEDLSKIKLTLTGLAMIHRDENIEAEPKASDATISNEIDVMDIAI